MSQKDIGHVDQNEINETRQAAIEVLLHNANGPFFGLPRTAGWGYPEPYTRDLMFSILGIAASGNGILLASIKSVLETLAGNQTERGHIPSLVHENEDRGASDTTPLFLLAVGIYRKISSDPQFLSVAVEKSLTWMAYQSPSDRFLIAQQPTSDWRDEQWVPGYGLFVNSVTYAALRLLGEHERASGLRAAMDRFTFTIGNMPLHVHEGTVARHKPYYALWVYKLYSGQQFDLLGNSIAILSGIASAPRAWQIIDWVEEQCAAMRERGELSLELAPNFFPYVYPGDPDWHERYARFNNPGDYHNGGIWPFVSAFHVAALVGSGRQELAERKLAALTRAVRPTASERGGFGFNEWLKAQDGRPMGQDWQTWSAAMYLYAVQCVERRATPFFDEIKTASETED